MYIAIAETGAGRKMLPLCQIEAENSLAGLAKLKQLLLANGIEAKRYLGERLKWKHTLFHVREIGGEEDLERILQAVHALERREEESEQKFAAFLNADL